MQKKPAFHFKKALYHGFVVENNFCGTHLHRHVEISYVTDGSLTFSVEQECYELRPGDLILVFPHQLHELSTPKYSKAITSIFDANLTSDYTKELTDYHLDSSLFHKSELAPSTLDALNILAHAGISKSFKQHAVPYAEKGFLSVILADLFSKRQLIPYNPTDSAFIITQFFNYIEKHLQDDLSLDAIAQALSISPSRLSSFITYYTGNTLHHHVNTRRLDHSRHLLSKTDLSVAEIASMCGFSSERSFYRNFKAALNKTPLEFRAKKSIAKK